MVKISDNGPGCKQGKTPFVRQPYHKNKSSSLPWKSSLKRVRYGNLKKLKKYQFDLFRERALQKTEQQRCLL